MTKIHDLLSLVPKFIFHSEKQIGEEKLVRYLAALMEAARMSGVSPEEQYLLTYLEDSLGLSTGVVGKARKLTESQAMTFGELLAGIEEPELRICILRDAYVMARMDKKIDNIEMLSLERLGGALGLSEGTVEKVVELVDTLFAVKQEIDKLGR